MNKLIYCITSVNKDMFGGIRAFFVGIPNIFTMGFYERHSTGLIALAAIVGIIVVVLGAIVLGVFVANTYFPDNTTAMMWLPLVFLWTTLFIGLYISALFRKCKDIS